MDCVTQIIESLIKKAKAKSPHVHHIYIYTNGDGVPWYKITINDISYEFYTFMDLLKFVNDMPERNPILWRKF